MVPAQCASLVKELACPARMSEQSGHNILVASPCKHRDIVPIQPMSLSYLTNVRYISALEERVAFLESRLPDHAEDHYAHDLEEVTQSSYRRPKRSPIAVKSLYELSSRDSQGGSTFEDHEVDDCRSLVDGVAYLSLCASGSTDTMQEPYYVGSSSGATIARVIQSSIFRNSGGRAANQPTTTGTRGAPATPKAHTPLLNSFEDHTHTFPGLDQARMLFDVFFERIHTRWPLLDRKLYTKLFGQQYIQGSLTIAERSILHLIYALTARFLSLTGKPCGVDYDVSCCRILCMLITNGQQRQLTAATVPMEQILDQHNLATVQFLILLGVHGQRSPYGAGAWSQIRYATSVCIEMGLHRRRTMAASREHVRDAEIRRRVFWSCYCLDRMTSIVLGRAFAIADRDINVEVQIPGQLTEHS
jgi:hypothetical protein